MSRALRTTEYGKKEYLYSLIEELVLAKILQDKYANEKDNLDRLNHDTYKTRHKDLEKQLDILWVFVLENLVATKKFASTSPVNNEISDISSSSPFFFQMIIIYIFYCDCSQGGDSQTMLKCSSRDPSDSLNSQNTLEQHSQVGELSEKVDMLQTRLQELIVSH